MRNLCCIAVILEMMENDPIFSIKRDVYDPGWNGTIRKELTVTFGVWNWKLWIFEEYFSHPVIYINLDAAFIINVFIVK